MERRINSLKQEIHRLRTLADGCAPDLKQQFVTLAKEMQRLVEEFEMELRKVPIR